MPTFRRLAALALVFCAFSTSAYAQTAPTIISQWTSGTAGQFNVQWSNPNTSSPQQIACSPASGSKCFLLNKAACDAAPVPISFAANATSVAAASSTNQGIYIWGLLNTSCSTTGYASSGLTNPDPNSINGSYLLGAATNLSQTFINGGIGLTFPGNPQYAGGLDPYGNPGTSDGTLYTHLDLMNQYLACDPNGGVNLSTFSLCIGVDGNGSGCVGQGCGSSSTATTTTIGGTTSSGGDYIAWAQVQIDTLPPAAPTIVDPKPLNGRVRFTVGYDSESLDTYTINVLSSSDPANVAAATAYDPADPTTGCGAWTQNFQTVENGVQPQTGTLPLTINGTNGITYAYCAQAIDYLRNPSTLSAPVTLTPQFECDLFDCYPGELQTGFCGAALTPAWFLLPAAAVALRRLRRKLRGR